MAALAGCGKRDAAPPAPPVQAEPPPVAPRVDDGLLAQLGREAAARPRGTPTVEEVLGALEQGGVAIARRQQVLALPLGAAYCVAAVSKAGLNLSICEFASEAQARAGRERSRQAFRPLAGRAFEINGRTLLTLMPAQQEAARERALAQQRFAALRATGSSAP